MLPYEGARLPAGAPALGDVGYWWFLDQSNVLRVARYLVRQHGYGSEQLLDFLEKPWHWSLEWQETREAP